MKRTEEEVLSEALLHLDKATIHASRGLADEVVLDAVALRILAMVDTLSRLPEPTLTRLFGGDWTLMRGMRNRLVHGYATVDTEVVKATIINELPAIRATIDLELSRR